MVDLEATDRAGHVSLASESGTFGIGDLPDLRVASNSGGVTVAGRVQFQVENRGQRLARDVSLTLADSGFSGRRSVGKWDTIQLDLGNIEPGQAVKVDEAISNQSGVGDLTR